jgi:hypothetical protein
MDMILQGWSTSLFHASQQWSAMSECIFGWGKHRAHRPTAFAHACI